MTHSNSEVQRATQTRFRRSGCDPSRRVDIIVPPAPHPHPLFLSGQMTQNKRIVSHDQSVFLSAVRLPSGPGRSSDDSFQSQRKSPFVMRFDPCATQTHFHSLPYAVALETRVVVVASHDPESRHGERRCVKRSPGKSDIRASARRAENSRGTAWKKVTDESDGGWRRDVLPVGRWLLGAHDNVRGQVFRLGRGGASPVRWR